MAKALWLRIAIVVYECRIAFSAPVVGQLQYPGLRKSPSSAFTLVLRGLTGGLGHRQEVQAEFHFGEIQLAQQAHAHHHYRRWLRYF